MSIFRKKTMNLAAIALSTVIAAGTQGHSIAEQNDELYSPQQVIGTHQNRTAANPPAQSYYMPNDQQYQLPSNYNGQYYDSQQDGAGYYGTQRTSDASDKNPSIYYYYYY